MYTASQPARKPLPGRLLLLPLIIATLGACTTTPISNYGDQSYGYAGTAVIPGPPHAYYGPMMWPRCDIYSNPWFNPYPPYRPYPLYGPDGAPCYSPSAYGWNPPWQ